MDPESGSGTWEARRKLYKTICLAYQSLGIVYGDLSTSPIYVYTSTFSGRLSLHEEDDEILGVLSLVFWTLTLIPLCKYIVFVLAADDDGEGGTFALYSLLCRRAKLGFLTASSELLEDNSPTSNSGHFAENTKSSSLLKELFDKIQHSKAILLLAVLLGTSMVIADGILTPSMSVLSAVYGVKIKVTSLHENYTVLIACAILMCLFALQHFGTHKVGFLFAPILLAWLFCISGVGIYNIVRWNPKIFGALSPYYIYKFFQRSGKDGWSSLGGIVLCVTGAEAMFADLGHFSQLSIRIAFCVVVYPCLILAYMGEAAYLSKHKQDLQRSFYRAIPEAVFWPVFIIATLATVVGSQAIISATFSIISQSRALRVSPRIKVIHTSNQIHGQIYIPEVNWTLMILCLIVVIGFRDTASIGHAYGLAVITVMLITTCLMFLIIIMIWKKNVLAASAFVVVFGSVELLYFSACIAKIHKGGWLALVFSISVLIVMGIWCYGTSMKNTYETENKVSLSTLLSLGLDTGTYRIPGIALVYSNVVSGVPPMFAHFVTNFPTFHQILVFVTIQTLTVPNAPSNQRFIISHIGSPEFRLYRCVVRFGYRDARKDSYSFENQLIDSLTEFLGHSDSDAVTTEEPTQTAGIITSTRTVRFRGVVCREQLENLKDARESGLVYMMGNIGVLACDSSSFWKKFVIDVVYGFLRRNCRHPSTELGVPHTSLIEVGMVYRV